MVLWPTGRPQRYTATQVIEALNATKGTVYLAARWLGCDAETVQRYCKRFPTVMAAKKSHHAELVDTAYLKLWAAVERGDMWAVLFTLRTLGKNQGFSERYEVTGKDGGPIQHVSIHMWEHRFQAVHAEMAARKAAMVAQRNGQAALPEGQGNGSVGEPTDTQ